MKTSLKLGALPRLGLFAALAGVVAAAGAAAPDAAHRGATSGAGSAVVLKDGSTDSAKVLEVNDRGLYIVGLRSAPLAMYAGGDARFASVPRHEDGKLDLKSESAQSYLEALQIEQDLFLNRLGGRLGRSVAPVSPKYRFQHAFNGFALQLSPQELQLVASDPEVVHLEGYREYQLLTDVGPRLIGAPAVWEGISTPNGLASRGEGIVVGVIDSGANLGSPSFAATDSEGYTHVNPLGEGNYLGWCNPLNPNHDPQRDLCNSKLIGGWDFVDFQITGENREAPGFEDENGHGSHTASTAAGNIRTATLDGAELIIEGVAPRANLVIYDACYSVLQANGRFAGPCPNVATVASINQAVADSVVDVINYSISGGAQPWDEATSLALLAAHNAGIFVSASAGNSGPGASTIGHNEPWVATVAASTHTRIGLGNRFSFTGPGAAPAEVTDMRTRAGLAPPLNNTFPLDSAPLIVSPTFNTAQSDGCAAFPAGTFVRGASNADLIFASSFEQGETSTPTTQGAIALLRWPNGQSDCGTVARANNAAAAGARGVVFLAEPPFDLIAAGGAQVPVFVLDDFASQQPLLDAIAADAHLAVGTLVETIEAFYEADAADVMARFSSRGPNTLSLLKPDVSAPGVDILATVSRWDRTTAPGSLAPALNDDVGLLSGTSMAAPHNAGAAALIKAINDSWTPSEIKSALMTTAVPSLRKEDAATPGDAFDYGAGRIDLSKAVRAGLLLNETGVNFAAANPATGGDPSQLNIPSFQNPGCTGVCSFDRRARNTRAGVTWTATVEGLPAGSGTVVPNSITPDTDTGSSFSLNIDSQLLPTDAWSFGQVVWTPSAADLPVARMPIAIRATGPLLQVPQDEISVLVEIDETATSEITLNNVGNPTLEWALGKGFQPVTFLDQGPQLGNGVRGSEHAASASNSGYAADDFDLAAPGTVTYLQSNGFVVPNSATLANATALRFRIYADDDGVPAGAPRNNGTEVGAAPVWEASVAPTAAGVSIATAGVNGNISLDLLAAGLTPPNLPAGKYWLVVTPTLLGSGEGTAENSLWGAAIVSVGAPVNGLAPRSRDATEGAAWAIPTLATAGGPVPVSGFSMVARGTLQCGAPWLAVAPESGSLGLAGSQSVTVTLDATGLVAGTYVAALCVVSNGGGKVIPVTMVVPSNDFNPGVEKSFSPVEIPTVSRSRLTVTLSNTTSQTLTSTANLVDSFPLGLQVANPPNAETTCVAGSVLALAGESSVTLETGAQIPPTGSCTVSVDVRSATAGTYENVIAAGALLTAPNSGSNQAPASASLSVRAPVFPEPYCNIDFTESADPITLVQFAGIDNRSSSTPGAALSDFLNVQGSATVGQTYSMVVEGNTEGDFPYEVVAYIDWNDDGSFDSGESYLIGVISNSDGNDGTRVSNEITVPVGVGPGAKRLRVVFQNPEVSGPCTGGGFGSAEDYTLIVN